jgi:hypothetical protein
LFVTGGSSVFLALTPSDSVAGLKEKPTRTGKMGDDE